LTVFLPVLSASGFTDSKLSQEKYKKALQMPWVYLSRLRFEGAEKFQVKVYNNSLNSNHIHLTKINLKP
jgi:hypothetical protein